MAVGKLRAVALGVTLAGATALAACGGDDATDPTAEDISGLYTLRAINGVSPPFSVVFEAGTAEYTYGALTLTDNGTDGGTYKQVIVGHWVGSARMDTLSDPGTYTRRGTDLAFVCDTCSNRTTTFGKIEGGRITATVVGVPIMLVDGRLPQGPQRSPILEGPPFHFVYEK